MSSSSKCGFVVIRSLRNSRRSLLIAQHHVSDRAGFEEWRSKVMPIIEQNGGRFVVRSDNVDVLEGDLKVTNIAIIEFADRATLNRAREQLKGHAERRRRAAKSVVLAAE